MHCFTEIAYLRSRYVRVIQTNKTRFEVQSYRYGKGGATWQMLYGVYDRDLAIRLMESYG